MGGAGSTAENATKLDRLEELSEELVTSESFYTSGSNSETHTHPNISIVDEDGEIRRMSRKASKIVSFGIPSLDKQMDKIRSRAISVLQKE